MRLRLVGVLVATAVVTACLGPPPAGRPVRDRRVITRADIEAVQVETAYDLVKRYRADFLRSRGATSLTQRSTPYAAVFLDELEFGTIESLRQIPANQIGEVRFYESTEAQTKFGSGRMGGVIAITSRRPSRG
jgi:hypothetical protein